MRRALAKVVANALPPCRSSHHTHHAHHAHHQRLFAAVNPLGAGNMRELAPNFTVPPARSRTSAGYFFSVPGPTLVVLPACSHGACRVMQEQKLPGSLQHCDGNYKLVSKFA